MILKYKAFTDKGTRKENQDSYEVKIFDADASVRLMDRGEIFIIADGMGGQKAGKKASREACRRIVDGYFNPDNEFFCPEENPDQFEAMLKNLFHSVNQILYDQGRSDTDLAGWGTTASMLVILKNKWFFVHAGDTRIYLLNSNGARLLTEDHNVAFQMYQFGKKTYEEYQQGKGHNKLLSYMAQGEGISILTGHGECDPKDIFLLCTDGLNQFVEFKEMETLATDMWKTHPDDFLEAFFDCLKNDRIKLDLAEDNVSFLMVGRELIIDN